MAEAPLRVLLVEDDEDDYVLIRDMLIELLPGRHKLQWEKTYETGLTKIKKGEYDICLLDYRLGEQSGIDLLMKAIERGCETPIILLTGYGDYEADLKAMRAGAADYLDKAYLNAPLLERSIRYTIERRRVEKRLRDSRAELRRLARMLIDAQERERSRVAQELHDSIGSSLVAIKYGLETRLDLIDEGKAPASSLDEIIDLIQNTISETRRVSMGLRPTILDDLGLVETISWLCLDLEKLRPDIRVEKRIDSKEDDVPEALKITIFRVLQEAVNNTSKHSQADRLRIMLCRTDDRIELSVGDNGQGFEMEELGGGDSHAPGMGIRGMKERTELSGGSFEIKSTRGSGTFVCASWPLPEDGQRDG